MRPKACRCEDEAPEVIGRRMSVTRLEGPATEHDGRLSALLNDCSVLDMAIVVVAGSNRYVCVSLQLCAAQETSIPFSDPSL